MDREEIKKRVYDYAPRSWFSLSGLTLGVISSVSNVGAYVEVKSSKYFEWKNFRIYTKKASEQIISFNLYINDVFFRRLDLDPNKTSLTYTFLNSTFILEDDIIKIELIQKDSNFINDDFYFSFTDSTWECFLEAITQMSYYIETEIMNLRNDIFLSSAKGLRLDQWASDFTELTRDVFDLDNIYSKKILTEILRPKQTRNAIFDSVKTILDEYFPYDLSGSGFYPSGSGSNSYYSGSGYEPIIIECFKEDAPYVALDDKGLPGRFYLTIPYELLSEKNESIFNAIQSKVEAIKTKGIKVVYIKDTKTENTLIDDYSGKILEYLTNAINWAPPQFEDEIVHTLTNSINDLNYVSQYESETLSYPLDVIDIKNTLTYEKISSVSEFEENYIFNEYGFYVGESYLYNEYASEQDYFTYLPFNYDRLNIYKTDGITNIVIIDELGI